MKIPENYLPVMPYIIVPNANDFLDFLKNVFGAKEQMIVPDEKDSSRGIMHGEVRIHDAVIMFANSTDDWKGKTAGMFIYVDNVDNIYMKALEAKSKSLVQPVQQDYGYTAGFEDPFGNQWWIAQGE